MIAEGAENGELWERLVTLGCDVVQGYYVSTPIPADEFGEWAEQSPWSGPQSSGSG